MTDTEPKMLRTLFCVAVNQNFHDLPLPQAQQLMGVFITALDDLKGRFGMEVLGTFDDDQMMVGASNGAPWTAYILADVPDLDSVIGFCNLFRITPALDGQLWKFAKIEARIGRKLFAGNA